ncbi:MAG: SRPBCC family protein [Asticcacaulis sp.]|uniref:SRPBCC family protein n=1 Tax=Asticcacaulis sp. TaxID=1872648 RepID=UPI0039E2F3EC
MGDSVWSAWTYDYNVSLLLLLPLIQGFAGGLARGRERHGRRSGFALIVVIMALDILLATFFMREGVICVIMASPLLSGMIALGYAIGRALVRRRRSRTLSVSLAPLAVLGVVMETAGPLPDTPVVVSDGITVDAPADYVWRYIVDYPDNPNPPDYWLWQAGLPLPTRSVATVQAVGAYRECRFSGGYTYGEVITKLEPGKMLAFRVTEQMKHPEIFGHVTFDEGEIALTPLDASHTRITMTGRYRLHVRPVPYFEWWAGDVTRHIHFRIMTYMKSLAERDYAADQRR